MQNAKEIYECPHVEARQTLIDVPDPVLGSARLVGPPFKLSGDPEPLTRAAPLLGEHTAEILRERLGYSEEKVTALCEQKELSRLTKSERRRRCRAPSAARSGSSAAP